MGFKNVLHTGKFIFSIEDQRGKSMHRLLDQMADRGLETILTVKDSGQEVAKFITGETSEYYEYTPISYGGFIVSIGRMWGSEPHKAKLIFSAEGTDPSLSIDSSVRDDTFTASSLTPYSGVVGMVVVYGTGTEPLSKIDLWEFAKSVIDNIIYDGGSLNSAADIRSAFYSTIDTIIGETLPEGSLYPHLEFYDGSNSITIDVTSSTGAGAAFDIKFDTEYYFVKKYGINGGSNYQIGDTFLASGTIFGGTSPANDCSITVTLVDNNGSILAVSITGTPNPAAVVWPIDNIEDGGDDQEDYGNYIYTNVSGFTYIRDGGLPGTGAIPYAGGVVSDGTAYFGGGSYVVTYKSSVFGIWATGATITSIGTDGNSGFDNDGVAKAENLSPAITYQVQALPINGSGYWSTATTYTISLDLNGYTGSQGFNNGVNRLDYYGDILLANTKLSIATRGTDNLEFYTSDDDSSNQSYLGLMHNSGIELYTSNSTVGVNEFTWKFDNKGVLQLPDINGTSGPVNGDHKLVLSVSSSTGYTSTSVDIFNTPGVIYSGTATVGTLYLNIERDGTYSLYSSYIGYPPVGWVNGEQVFIPGTVFGGTSPANDCTATLSLVYYGINSDISWTVQGTSPYTPKLFTFDYDGSLTFPDATVQTTAWLGGGSSSLSTNDTASNNFNTGNFTNQYNLDIEYTAFTGDYGVNFDITYQKPLDSTKGVTVGAIETPLIMSTATVILKTDISSSTSTWTFGTDGDLTLPGQLLFPEGTTFYNNGISVSSGTQYGTSVQGNTSGINQYWFADGTMPTRKWAAVRVNSPEDASTGSVVLSTGAFNSRNNWIFAHDGSTVLPENTLKGYCFTATNAVFNYIPTRAAFMYTDSPVLAKISTIGGPWYIKGPGLIGWKQITGVLDNGGGVWLVDIGPMSDGSEFHSGGYQPNSPDLVYTISQYLELDVKVADKTWTFNQAGSVTFPDSTVQTTAYIDNTPPALAGLLSTATTIAITTATAQGGPSANIDVTITNHQVDHYNSTAYTGNILSTGLVVIPDTTQSPPIAHTILQVGSQSLTQSYSLGTNGSPAYSHYIAYAYVVTPFGTVWSAPTSGQFGSICLIAGTMILLSDGTRKAIEDITYTDKLQSWNFDQGCYAETTALWIKQAETGYQYNLLTFSDGTTLRTFDQHRIFNKEAGAFTYPMTDATPIGTTTVNEHGQEITLVDKQVIVDTIEYYNVITDYHMNLFSDTILTSCRFNNIYPITDMKFVKDGRTPRTRDEFADIPDRFFYGLRLAEQTTDIETVEWYVTRLLALEESFEAMEV
jgi:hypothetical protein